MRFRLSVLYTIAKILGRISASEDDIITRFSKSSESNAKTDELAKYKDAKVSTAKVSDLSLEQLRKERKSLEFGIKNGKTESHIELRKERLKDVEAEISKRTQNYTN